MMQKSYLKDDLLTILGLNDLSDQKKEEMVFKIGEIVHQRVILRVLEKLSDEDKKEFDQILSQDDGEKIRAFLKTKLPDFEEMVKEEIEKFRQEAASKMQAIVNF